MGLKLAITGMDRATEVQLRAAFEQAARGAQGRWELTSEPEADYMLVDMDSMYGPMSWIRLHAAGKQVIALTASARTQADHLLANPFDAGSVAALLHAIEGTTPVNAVGPNLALQHVELAHQSPSPAIFVTEQAGVVQAPFSTASDTSAEAVVEGAPDADLAPPPLAEPEAPPSAATPAPAPADTLREEQTVPVDEEAAAPPEPAAALEPASPVAPDPTPVASTAPDLTPAPSAATSPEPASPPTPDPQPVRSPSGREPMLADWLAANGAPGRWRFQRDGVAILVDADARTWHGSALLKPLLPLFAESVRRDALEPLDAAAWAAAATAAGPAQPLSRLQWLGGLAGGHGALLPGHDPAGRYRLAKWPQTEREFPRHFRLATAMMKGPATVAELATASGASQAETADFVNASLVTGFAEFVPEQPPEPAEPARPTGLLGRLRGR